LAAAIAGRLADEGARYRSGRNAQRMIERE
jgi:hypothetical protein